MSFNGITQFKKNLEALMESEAFKEADDAHRLILGGALMRSRYGLGGLDRRVCALPVDARPSPPE
jgi:hypothetical protein